VVAVADAGRITEVDFVLDRHKLTRLSAHNKQENARAGTSCGGRRMALWPRRPSADTPRPLRPTDHRSAGDRDEGGKMAAIVESIEIARRPEDVFAYATDSSRFPEWQASAVSVRQEGTGPLAVGCSAVVTRRLGPRELPGTEEITALHPPRTWAWRTGGGPVTGTVNGAIEPLDGGRRSRVTIALEFEGHGIGRLLVPLVVRRQARRQLPKNEQKLKEVLER